MIENQTDVVEIFSSFSVNTVHAGGLTRLGAKVSTDRKAKFLSRIDAGLEPQRI